MVSIPPDWTRFSRLDQPRAGNSHDEATKRYYKNREVEAIRTAEEQGYFFNLTKEFLVEKFCYEKYKEFQDIHYIKHVKLVGVHLRHVNELGFAMRLRICILSNNYISKLDSLGTCRQLLKLDVHSNQVCLLHTFESISQYSTFIQLILHSSSLLTQDLQIE